MTQGVAGGLEPIDWEELVPALRLWSGIDDGGRPQRRTELLFATYGSEQGEHLLSQVVQLVAIFNQSMAFKGNPGVMGALVWADFRRNVPGAPGGAIQVLLWQYLNAHRDRYGL